MIKKEVGKDIIIDNIEGMELALKSILKKISKPDLKLV